MKMTDTFTDPTMGYSVTTDISKALRFKGRANAPWNRGTDWLITQQVDPTHYVIERKDANGNPTGMYIS